MVGKEGGREMVKSIFSLHTRLVIIVVEDAR
jgi:hypothetical protein